MNQQTTISSQTTATTSSQQTNLQIPPVAPVVVTSQQRKLKKSDTPRKRAMSLTELSEDSINHTKEFINDISNLLNTKLFSDITLLVGENETPFKAHKCVLAARCKYFYGLFNSQMKEATADVLKFPDKDPKDFKSLLDYFYTAKYVYKCLFILLALI